MRHDRQPPWMSISKIHRAGVEPPIPVGNELLNDLFGDSNWRLAQMKSSDGDRCHALSILVQYRGNRFFGCRGQESTVGVGQPMCWSTVWRCSDLMVWELAIHLPGRSGRVSGGMDQGLTPRQRHHPEIWAKDKTNPPPTRSRGINSALGDP